MEGKSGGMGMLRKIQSRKFWEWVIMVALIPIVNVSLLVRIIDRHIQGLGF
jgi:hypothetical protein